jgi:hypothetical protein
MLRLRLPASTDCERALGNENGIQLVREMIKSLCGFGKDSPDQTND